MRNGQIHRWLLLAGLGSPILICACDRSSDPTSQPASVAKRPDRVAPPPKPEYRFAEDLRDRHPEIVAFLRHLLETSLAGDYAGYRRLVSHTCDPESRDRFQAVFRAIRSLAIQSIEPLDLPQVAEQTYRVVGEVEFHPGSKVRLRRKNNKIAILVLKEEGQWRMMPAPSALQPDDQEQSTTTSAPTTSAPSYPWDEDGDF